MLPHTNLQARLTIFGLERTTLRASMRSTAANMQLPRPAFRAFSLHRRQLDLISASAITPVLLNLHREIIDTIKFVVAIQSI